MKISDTKRLMQKRLRSMLLFSFMLMVWVLDILSCRDVVSGIFNSPKIFLNNIWALYLKSPNKHIVELRGSIHPLQKFLFDYIYLNITLHIRTIRNYLHELLSREFFT